MIQYFNDKNTPYKYVRLLEGHSFNINISVNSSSLKFTKNITKTSLFTIAPRIVS